ncbi:hypothetical protein Psal006b_02617 [Piscirickettsia salmonis]|uniref:Uncharacterized protein n=1 Tax=Piscirickettsia salmonis TaxID=1238 RepID=A0A1L6T9E6_PISSA|nr:hypothetical protein [Piscirickettsia salmonis]AKP73126.1 hypothetical protein PSLF89_1111 [Piscirickettsia salmonis LF-89 = ATCC VR-1361]ALB21783.1 hypothetical protein KU39_599 [Piscirickettsia salmonis]ALY01968.1 hypothetical protein AWE47_03020 [Piscirickettsia salmonis]AMA41478.1 hypothetical protein AWJ11_03010 [Piscirickettsia salmonis]AOS33964.1 hypothetical protein AVM72_00260 [Piscirickettsia salmonis]
MKFGQILKLVRPGDLSSINTNTLKMLGERYIEKYPQPNYWGNHNQQDKAKELTQFHADNPHATPKECCQQLITVMQELKNANGWLATKTTDLLNKVFNTHVPTSHIITGVNPQIKLRDVKDIARDFRVILHTLTRAEEAHQAQAPQQGVMILQVSGQEPVRLIPQPPSPEFSPTDWQAGLVRKPTACYLGTDLFLSQIETDLDIVAPDQDRESSPE